MHNDGVAAGLFDLFALFSFVSCITILLMNYNESKNRCVRYKNILMIYSFVPLMMIAGVVAIISTTQYAVSATIISPLIIIYVSFSYYFIINKDVIALFDKLNCFIRKQLILAYLRSSAVTYKDIKQLKNEIDAQFIENLMAKHNNNIMSASKEMAVHHQTLRNKMKEMIQ